MRSSTLALPNNAPPTVALMGLDVAAVSERETINYVLDGLGRRRGGWVCPANLDVLRQWRGSADVRELVAAADLVVADGMPLVWAGAASHGKGFLLDSCGRENYRARPFRSVSPDLR